MIRCTADTHALVEVDRHTHNGITYVDLTCDTCGYDYVRVYNPQAQLREAKRNAENVPADWTRR